MKLVIDIKDNKADLFIELMKSLDFIKTVKELKEERKSQFIQDMTEAFQEVKLHQEGKIKLMNAKDMINELRGSING